MFWLCRPDRNLNNQVVRSRLQEQGQARNNEVRYKGVIDCIKKVYRKEGLPGFYRGCATNLLRTTPSAVITFTSYEMIRRFLDRVIPPEKKSIRSPTQIWWLCGGTDRDTACGNQLTQLTESSLQQDRQLVTIFLSSLPLREITFENRNALSDSNSSGWKEGEKINLHHPCPAQKKQNNLIMKVNRNNFVFLLFEIDIVSIFFKLIDSLIFRKMKHVVISLCVIEVS